MYRVLLNIAWLIASTLRIRIGFGATSNKGTPCCVVFGVPAKIRFECIGSSEKEKKGRYIAWHTSSWRVSIGREKKKDIDEVAERNQ